jgi:methylmalonyl-CoA mutase N-terminal domain/subunit
MTQDAECQFRTLSGIPLKNVYTPEDIKDLQYERDVGLPGEPPYTRGTYRNMYRDRLWRIFELSGTGTPEDERERLLYLLNHGETGIIMEVDQLTSYHLFDPDHPDVLARKDDVGLCGPPLVSLKDYETVLEEFPLDKIYAHPGGGCIQFSPFAHACYWSLAQKRGINLDKLSGTGQSDYFLSYLGCPLKDQIPPGAGLRLNCDLIEFCTERLPHWVPVSIPGYNASETGVNAYQELALVMANAIAYIDGVLKRGRFGIDDFAHGIGGVNYASGRDFFEDLCKMRAARRMWYKLLTERYGAKDPRSFMHRIHVVTTGSWMTYQQPLNNIVRSTVYALSAALGGVQSIGVSSYDEGRSTPSEAAHLIAVRTQQILQHESGLASVADPLAGSYYVEWLTDELERHAWDYLKKIEEQGGFIQALDSGWMHREAMKGMLEREKAVKAGEIKVVGLNCFQMEEEPHEIASFRANPRAWEVAMGKLERLRKERDNVRVAEALAELREVCCSQQNIMPVMMKAIQAYATIGEVGDIFREVFSIWKPPIPV